MKFINMMTVAMVLGLSGATLSASGLSSLVFYEYSIQDFSTTGEFEINRAYLTYNNKVSDKLSFKVTTDVGRLKNDSDNPHLYVFLKNAKLDYVTDFGKLTFGLQGMNMFNVQEKNWGYRFIEKSVMDKYGFSSSADLGIAFATSLMGKLNTSVMITNGSGYKKPETDNHKKLSVQLVGGDGNLSTSGSFNAGSVLSYEPYDVSADTTGTRTIIGGFAGYKLGALQAGGELDVLFDSEETDKTMLIAIYGDFILSKKLKIFGRVDRSGSRDHFKNYLIAGARITPASGFDIAPNIRIMDDVDPVYALNFQLKF